MLFAVYPSKEGETILLPAYADEYIYLTQIFLL